MISNRFDKIFDEMFGGSLLTTPHNMKRQKTPQVNIYQDESGYELEMKAAGLERDNISIEVENNVLVLTCAYSEQEKYERRFELPQKVNTENISASMAEGILSLKLPEAAEKKPQRIEIMSA